MDLHDGIESQARFQAYLAKLASVLGHADRIRPFGDYCIGLLSAEGRKSVEPLAAVTARRGPRAMVRCGDPAARTGVCFALHHP
jgi:SRSO17 transposase